MDPELCGGTKETALLKHGPSRQTQVRDADHEAKPEVATRVEERHACPVPAQDDPEPWQSASPVRLVDHPLRGAGELSRQVISPEQTSAHHLSVVQLVRIEPRSACS